MWYYIHRTRSEEAKSYFLRAAECNHVEATLRYADMVLHGRWSMASIWYQRALNLAKGCANEAVLSGHAYRGLGLVATYQRSHIEAMAHYRRGALMHDAECCYNVGNYLNGAYGQPRDVRAAYHWFRLAAAGGALRAAGYLGLCLPLFSSPAPAAL